MSIRNYPLVVNYFQIITTVLYYYLSIAYKIVVYELVYYNEYEHISGVLMRPKTEKRRLAERLRIEQGLSYAEISKLAGVSKSTLSAWLKDISLTNEQQLQLQGK